MDSNYSSAYGWGPMNLTLEDVYHPDLMYFYEYNLYTAFVLTNLSFLPAIYVVATQSKNATMYKYLLINQLCWSYFHDIVFTIWIHVPLFPISAIYFRGVGVAFGSHSFMIHLPIHLLVSVGHTQSYMIAALYRLSYASGNPTTKFQHWFRSGPKLTGLVIGSWVFFSIPVVVPCLFGDYEVWRHTQLPKNPILQQLLKLEPTVSGYPFFGFSDASIGIAISLIAYANYTFIFFFAGIGVYTYFVYQTLQMRSFMSKQTYKIHMILFWALTIQLTSVFVLLFLPFIVQYLVFMFQLKHGSTIALLMFIPMNYHLVAEIVALGYFVKPYREYLVGLWGRLTPCGQSNRKESTTPIQTSSNNTPSSDNNTPNDKFLNTSSS